LVTRRSVREVGTAGRAERQGSQTGMSCWAASAAIVVGWRDQVSIDPTAIVAGTGIWSAYTNGLARSYNVLMANFF
jgi:hypothetical protein